MTSLGVRLMTSAPFLVAASSLLAAFMSLVTNWVAADTVLTETITFASGLLTAIVCGMVYLSCRAAPGAADMTQQPPPVKEVIVTIDMVQCLTGGAPVPLGVHLSDDDEVLRLTEGGPAHKGGDVAIGDRIVRVGATRVNGAWAGGTAVSADQRVEDLIRVAATTHGRVVLTVERAANEAKGGDRLPPRGAWHEAWGELWPHVAQSALGGAMPHLIFYSISLSGLAVSNCLVFMMPLWTGVFVCCLAGRAGGGEGGGGGGEGGWGLEDVALAIVSLLGVVLVSQPGSGAFSAAGVAAGVAAGIVGGLLNFLFACNAALRAADSWYLVACQGLATMGFSLPSLLAHRGLNMGRVPMWGGTFLAEDMLLGLVGILFILSQQLRFFGLQVATSSSVVTLLYTEVVWAFVFEQLFTDTPPANAAKYVGVILIVGGAVVHELGYDKVLFDLCRPSRLTRFEEPAPIRLAGGEPRELELGHEGGAPPGGGGAGGAAGAAAAASLSPYALLFGFSVLLCVGAADLKNLSADAEENGAVAKTSRLLETHMEVWSVVLGICVGAAFAYSLGRLRL